jgi:hypothetical protein
MQNFEKSLHYMPIGEGTPRTDGRSVHAYYDTEGYIAVQVGDQQYFVHPMQARILGDGEWEKGKAVIGEIAYKVPVEPDGTEVAPFYSEIERRIEEADFGNL